MTPKIEKYLTGRLKILTIFTRFRIVKSANFKIYYTQDCFLIICTKNGMPICQVKNEENETSTFQ